MPLGKKRLALVEQMNNIIADINHKMTVRQLYYQLVIRGIISNTVQSYNNYDHILTRAREEGLIDPHTFIDRSKPVIKYPSWSSLQNYISDIGEAYKRDIWGEQPEYVEVWLEKDALRDIFSPITDKYDVHLVIGRGYQSYTNLLEAAQRINNHTDGEKAAHILYFGDFDPSGVDIPRNIESRLCNPDQSFVPNLDLEIIAITSKQIEEYNIPPMPVKRGDTRAALFLEQHGNRACELDALDPAILERLIEDSITKYLDEELFEQMIIRENEERERLQAIIEEMEL